MTIGAIRFAIFLGLIIGFAAIEHRFPARPWRSGIRARWISHGALGGLSLIVPALLLRSAPIFVGLGAAAWAERAGFGLFHWLALPPWLAIAPAILMLDLAIYAQHRALHRWPLLWRLHAVHHHDHDLDVTTALRFHPGEIFLSVLYKAGIAAIIGAPVVAVVIHETLLNGMAIFNHANIVLPRRAERIVQPILVTPTMHVRHHSTVRSQHDANYGNLLSIWDRLFGSYWPEPREPEPFVIGLAQSQRQSVIGLGWLLALPFR